MLPAVDPWIYYLIQVLLRLEEMCPIYPGNYCPFGCRRWGWGWCIGFLASCSHSLVNFGLTWVFPVHCIGLTGSLKLHNIWVLTIACYSQWRSLSFSTGSRCMNPKACGHGLDTNLLGFKVFLPIAVCTHFEGLRHIQYLDNEWGPRRSCLHIIFFFKHIKTWRG